MKLKKLALTALGVSVGLTSALASTAVYAAGEQFFPMLVYRTGPYAPSGIPVANGFREIGRAHV